MKITLTQPKNVIIAFGFLFFLNLLVFGQTAERPTTFETTAQMIGYITSFVTFIALVAGIFWYVFKGKNLQRLNEDLAEYEKRDNRQRNTIADLEKELLKTQNKLRISEENEEKLKKANLKLQGLDE